MGFYKVSGGCLIGVGVWKVSGKFLEGVWKVYEKSRSGLRLGVS